MADSKEISSKVDALRQMQELPRLIERMHRRFLDVIRLELGNQGIRDISPVQVMMLANIGPSEISVRDLIERGYYLGSNASYNLKQLVDTGYVVRQASAHDKRAALLTLSPKGTDALGKLNALQDMWAEPLLADSTAWAEVEKTFRLLRRLEHRWSDAVRSPGDAGDL